MSTELSDLDTRGTARGLLDGLPEPSGRFGSATESKLTAILEENIGLDAPQRDDNLWDLGLDSMQAISLILQIEKKLKRTLTVAMLLEAPTVKELAQLIDAGDAGSSGAAVPSGVVLLRPRQSDLPPLFFMHLSGGELTCYAALTAHMSDGRAIYGLRPRDEKPYPVSMEELAAQHVASIKSVQAQGPYLLAGYCFGALLAFEVARQMTASGEKVALLALLDFPFNVMGDPFKFRWGPLSIWKFTRNLGSWVKDFIQVDQQARARILDQKFGSSLKRVRRLFGAAAPVRPGEETGTCPIGVLPELWEAHEEAWRRYQPKPYPGKATLLRLKSLPISQPYDPTLGWGHVIRDVQVRIIAGPLHGDAFKPGYVRIVAKQLDELLNASLDVT